jgi:hypothetical protein
MAQFRLIYDANNSTATIVLTDISADVVKRIGSEILSVTVEPATMLKGNGFKDDEVVIPATDVVTQEEQLPFKQEAIATQETKEVKAEAVSAEITTNPVPEDSKSGINLSLLDAPVADKVAPPISNDKVEVVAPTENTVDVNTTEDVPDVDEYVFSFGSYKGNAASDMIATNPSRAFSYFKWLLKDGVLKNRNPNEDIFKVVVYKHIKNYFSCTPLTEEVVKDVAYIVIASIDEAKAKEILNLLGYSSIEEFEKSDNIQCYSDAITMAFAVVE